MNGIVRETSMAGRMAAGILAASCLLLPGRLSAQERPPAPGPASGAGTRPSQPAVPQAEPVTREELDQVKQRIEELETSATAHEDATRSIIRQTFSEWGAKINEFVAFGGTVEVLSGWGEDFNDLDQTTFQLSTVQLDFEIQMNDWTLGSIILEYVDGTNVLFPTTEGGEASIDRINVDTAFVTIGNTERFPLYTTAGRMIVPFGISTGDPVADVLTIESPLTVEVFENKEDAVLVGFALPTPPLTPTAPRPTTTPPPVKPLLINPLVSTISQFLGYKPLPPTPAPQTPTIPAPTPPPFTGAIYLYNGGTTQNSADREWRQPLKHMGGTLGYRTKGDCLHFYCPWTFDADVDFSGSVFDSLFLVSEYEFFLDQLRYVPGMAGHVKSSLGPVSIVAEWNGAMKNATLQDDRDRFVNIKPSAWQLALGYQFDWNPWVESIGAQGTYLALGYSESRDMEGITADLNGVFQRIGFVPKRRFLVGFGEWVLEGLRVAVEYSHIVDYSKDKRGTGNSASGAFVQLTYQW